MTALSNALGTVTTLAYINPGSGGGGGGGGVITPAATLSRTSGKAGLAVYFDFSGTTATTTTDPEHELHYAVDFGDERGETWSFGTDTTRSKNIAYGPQAAHVYTVAGVYSPTLYVSDLAGNNVAAYPLGTITVSAWTEAETIYIANGSTPTAGANGVGSGAAGYYNETTWAGVVSRFSANKRIRLNNASTWAASSTGTCPNGMQVDGYGAGTKWNVTTGTWTYGAVFSVKSRSDVRIMGGKHTGTGRGNTAFEASTVGGGAGGTGITDVLVMGMESTANLGLWDSSSNTGIDRVFLIDNDCHDYGLNAVGDERGAIPVYMEDANRVAIIGCRAKNVQSSHCMRIAGVNRGVFTNNNIEDPRDRPGELVPTTHGLTIRGFTYHSDYSQWTGLWTEKVLVRENVFKAVGNAAPMLYLASQNDGDAARLQNCIMEDNYFDVYNAGSIWSKVSNRCTIRNNIMKIAKAGWAIQIASTADVGITTPPPTDTKIYNNTVWKTSVSDLNGDGFSAIYVPVESGAGAITGLVIKNNLAYAPYDTHAFQNSGTTGPAFVETTGSVTYTASNNSTNTQIKNSRPWAATSPVTYADYAPDAGSYAKDGGASVPVIKDFLNAAITGTRDIGAVQA
jgi:hypothetical protein